MGELVKVLKSQKNHRVMGDRKRSTEVSRFNPVQVDELRAPAETCGNHPQPHKKLAFAFNAVKSISSSRTGSPRKWPCA